MRSDINIEIAKKFGIDLTSINIDNDHSAILSELQEFFDNLMTNNEYKDMIEDCLSTKIGFVDRAFDIIKKVILDGMTPNDIKLKILYLSKQYLPIVYNLIDRKIKYRHYKDANDDLILPIDFYTDFIRHHFRDWTSSENKYLNCMAVSIVINSRYICHSDFFLIVNSIFSNRDIGNGDNNLIEFIAKSYNETYYKPIMFNIMDFVFGNLSEFMYNVESSDDGTPYTETEREQRNNIKQKVLKSVYDLLYYNKDSNDIFDVLIRGAAYRIIRNRMPGMIDNFDTSKFKAMDFVEDNDYNHRYYMYIGEDEFYECSMNELGIYKKLDDGTYLVPEYEIDSLCFDREWFINHPEADYIKINDVPEFFSTVSSDMFDLAFNSDPNLFNDAFIIYYDKESAKKAFMESHK